MPVPVPGAPDDPSKPFTVEDFGSLDTKAARPALNPKDFPWLQNWIPLGPGNMRTLYAENTQPLYTAGVGRTIVYFFFYNLAAVSYVAVFLDDGTAYQVAVAGGAVTTISAVASTFYTGSALPACAQWQSKYLLIAAPMATNGYWIWNGTALFTNGGLQPVADLNGSGLNYTSAPTVTAHGGAGSGATFAAVVKNGSVTEVNTTNPGSGYLITDVVTLSITGGGSDDQATAHAVVDLTKGGVTVVNVTNGGAGYSRPLVAITGGGGTGALAFVSGAANGVITDITVTNPGTGFTGAPTVTITDTSPGTGTGATANGEIRRGIITSIVVDTGGSGYVGMPDVVISEPDGLEFPTIQAEAVATISGGAVTAITLTVNGVGYRNATVDLSGGNNSAEAAIAIMPFGIVGGAIETYQDRVWVFSDTKFSYTSAESVADFSGSGGGGSKPITDSFLRQKIIAARQSSGFLYRFGDSSINVISNVQTSSAGITTFNDSNVDAQIGTAWRDSVAAFGRALVFANPTGVYALYGGAAEKVSSQLDGLFAKASFNTGVAGLTPTAAVCTIFGIRVYALSFTTVNPFTGALQDMMVCWDGQRWFPATQLTQPAVIGYQEINSVLTAWGAKNRNLYQLFQTPSNSLEKIFQTKLVAAPNYMTENQVTAVAGIVRTEPSVNETLNITVDNEGGSGPVHQQVVVGNLSWINNNGDPITWSGAGGVPLSFSVRGLSTFFYGESNYGSLIGATARTFATDMTMISLTVMLREFSTNVP